MSASSSTAHLLNPLSTPLTARSTNIPSRPPQNDCRKPSHLDPQSLLPIVDASVQMSSPSMFTPQTYPNLDMNFSFGFQPPPQPNHNHSDTEPHANDPSTRHQPRQFANPRPRPSQNPLIRDSKSSRADRAAWHKNRYLDRMRAKRGERVWNVREDQIQHHDFLSEQRAWEDRLRESAPELVVDGLDQVDELDVIDEMDEIHKGYGDEDMRVVGKEQRAVGGGIFGNDDDDGTGTWFGSGSGAPQFSRVHPLRLQQPPLHARQLPLRRNSNPFSTGDSMGPPPPPSPEPENEVDAVLRAEELELEATLEANNMYAEEDQLPPPVPPGDAGAGQQGQLNSEMELLDSDFEAEMGELVEKMQGQGIRQREADGKGENDTTMGG
ncbi:MAG: hypothetical protein M1831_003364 [Alyxoria varia]|nr:MAG: hypothetical protein M1831_003364 [Alyxoria varia]